MIDSESNFNTWFGHEKSVRQDVSKEPQDWAEGQSEVCVFCSSGRPWEGARILQSRYHRWWIMDFGVRRRDKTPESGVAHCKISPSQESENEQIQNQINAYLFFWQSRDRPQGICATRINCQSNFLSGSPWKTQEKGGTCATRYARTWMLHYDNTPCHTAVSINEFLVPQPPYSLNLIPCDLFLFARLKNHLKGRHFGTLDNIQKSVTEELKGIPAETFQHCYEQWKQRLRRCVAVQGNYFEKEYLDF